MAIELLEPIVRQDPILVPQLHQIGGAADGDQVDEIVETSLVRSVAHGKGLHELEAHPASGELLEWVSRVGSLRIEQRHAIGSLTSRQVVVADDDVDAQLGCLLDHQYLFRPAVERDQQGTAALLGEVQCLVRDPAPLRVAVRYVKLEQRRDLSQVLVYQRHGGRPVDIVVAVDQYPLLITDRLIDPPDCCVHILHEEGIVQLAQPRLKEVLRLIDAPHPPLHHK